MRYAIDNYVIARRSVVSDSAQLYEVGGYFAFATFIDVPGKRVGKGLFPPCQNTYPLHTSPVLLKKSLVPPPSASRKLAPANSQAWNWVNLPIPTIDGCIGS